MCHPVQVIVFKLPRLNSNPSPETTNLTNESSTGRRPATSVRAAAVRPDGDRRPGAAGSGAGDARGGGGAAAAVHRGRARRHPGKVGKMNSSDSGELSQFCAPTSKTFFLDLLLPNEQRPEKYVRDSSFVQIIPASANDSS